MLNKNLDEIFIEFFGMETFSSIEEVDLECYIDNHDIDMVIVDELGQAYLSQDANEGFPEVDVKIGEFIFDYESPDRRMQLGIKNLDATIFLIGVFSTILNFIVWLIMWMAQ